MSSHHFVKEGQEPALLLVDALSHALVEPLLEWAPLVIVTEHALNETLTWGIKIDVVLCPADLIIQTRERVTDQQPVEILPYQPHESVLLTAIRFLQQSHQQAVNLVAELTDDHFQLAENFPSFPIALLNREVKWTRFQFGYSKWLPAKTNVLIRKTSTHQSLKTAGLMQNDRYLVTSGDGVITIESTEPFWVGESIQ